MSVSRRLTIFEGPDGSGKTTLARAYAERTRAHYVHLGPFPRVSTGLARLYAEAMAPAVLGLADVVLDRSWLSERPYGDAFREGRDRLGSRARQLERLALRCAACVVRCLPPLGIVEEGFAHRRQVEYLTHVEQLRQVYASYGALETALPMITLNPLNDRVETCVAWVRDHASERESTPHDLAWRTAGNLRAPILIVGQDFGETGNNDSLVRWPFGDADGGLWLSNRLDDADVSETCLCWADSESLPYGFAARFSHVIILGVTAGSTGTLLGADAPIVHRVGHPGEWRRFHARKGDYPLIAKLKEILCTP